MSWEWGTIAVKDLLSLFGPIIGAVVAIGGLRVTLRARNREVLIQHTFNMLLQMSFNEKYQASLKALRPKWDSYTFASPKEPFSEQEHKAVVDAMTTFLNHYEFVAIGINHGALAEEILWDDQSHIVFQLHKYSASFIEEIRAMPGKAGAFEAFLSLHSRWKQRSEKLSKRAAK